MNEYGVVCVGDLELESGEVLPKVELAYERAGQRDGEIILVCHALTGNQFTVGSNHQGWWSGLIGAGKYIDTSTYQVITFNVLGGCSGSTGPLSINPNTGELYKNSFPFVTVRDMVHAQAKALQKMGISRVRAIIGGSLGGMQVLEWGLLYPTYSDLLIPLAVTPVFSDYGIAFNTIARRAIEDDPSWQNGEYENGEVLRGLEIARMIGMVTYRTDSLFNQRFKKERKVISSNQEEFQVESYLKYQGEKLARRFDANSYVRLLNAMNNYDIGFSREGWKKALQFIQSKILLIGYSGDLLYPPTILKEMASVLKQYRKKVIFHKVETDFGHDGFLAEYSKWGTIIKRVIERGIKN
ncbi:homoserine O-acetyltransferase [Bacillus sp. RG28]|uniref:Homoserine O-acetyltransferase n=1 Tax=Gottfriedia endophytica TaxID=2820819 RepID=A0A940NGE6_9BACI|nr:homoserine O-acetyltransferase [Gottfriedia endophytica]